MPLQQEIETLYESDPASLDRHAALKTFGEFKFFLNQGEIRAARKVDGVWQVNGWVKKGFSWVSGWANWKMSPSTDGSAISTKEHIPEAHGREPTISVWSPAVHPSATARISAVALSACPHVYQRRCVC